jgi:hypothetical protein
MMTIIVCALALVVLVAGVAVYSALRKDIARAYKNSW